MPQPPDERFTDEPSPDEPRRRRREEVDDDDDDDKRGMRDIEQPWIDKQMLNTPMWVLVFFAVCCNSCFMLPLVFGIVGLATTKDPRVKERAKIVTIISGIMVGLALVAQLLNMALGLSLPGHAP